LRISALVKDFRNLSLFTCAVTYSLNEMNGATSHLGERPTRVKFQSITPAVLQFPDGQRTPGEVRVVSLSGGLLCLSEPFDKGTAIKLMFLTHSGPVIAGAELLNPVTTCLQPFRFTELPQDDQNRLEATIQSLLNRGTHEQKWIEKYRAAVVETPAEKKKTVSRFLLGAAGLGVVSAISALYFSRQNSTK